MNYLAQSRDELIKELELLNSKYNELEKNIQENTAKLESTQKALVSSENKYRKLVENMNDIIWEVGPDLSIKFISSGIEKVTGFNPSEMIGKNLFLFIEPRNAEELKKSFESRQKDLNAKKDIQTGLFKHNQLCKNGEYKWLEALSNPILDEKNNLLGFYGISRDISFQERADEKLKLSEDKLSKVFHSAPYLITIVRVSDLKMVEINLVVEEILGFTRDEILKDPSLILYIWDDKEQREKYFNSIKELRTLKNFEIQYKTKDGSIGSALMGTEYLTVDYELCVLAYFEVITEHKRALDALHKSQANLLALVENTSDHIWAIDSNYNLIFLNEQFKIEFQKSYGIELSPGIKILDCLSKEIGCLWKSRYDKALANEHVEFVDHFDFGEIQTYVEVAMNPIVDNGQIIGVSIFAHDITKRKQAEILIIEKNKEIEAQNQEYQQLNENLKRINKEFKIAKEKAEESDRLKTAFLQNMSHEIRTPMNAIMGFSSLLSEQYNNKEKLELYAGIINQRCTDLLEIINDILDIAKIESGQLSVNLEICNLNFLFLEIMAFFKEHQKRISKQHIQLTLDCLPCESGHLILTDPGKLKQILINLIGNAFKFIESGKIEVGCMLEEIRSNSTGKPKNLKFYIKDTGIGIRPEKQEIIFERFVQLNENQKKIYGGTGLGLSIVKGIVEILKGEIWLESEVGIGTTFYFTIPYETTKSQETQSVKIEGFTKAVFEGITILVVEDDNYNTEFLKNLFIPAGFIASFAENGNEAIQKALEQDFDIILMDIRLPDMDGYEATRQIKLKKNSQKIIAQTAYASAEDKTRAIDAGCIDHISKPIKKDDLFAMILKYQNRA